jgi:hypothetical protein
MSPVGSNPTFPAKIGRRRSRRVALGCKPSSFGTRGSESLSTDQNLTKLRV